MSDNVDKSSESEAQQSPASAATVDYEKRYKGLDAKFQKTVAEYEAELTKARGITDNLARQAADWQKKAEEAATAKAEWETKFQQTDKEKQQIAQEAATSKRILERTNLLTKPEFLPLIPFERDGLLRTDLQGTEFETYLQNLGKKVVEIGKTNLKELLAGSAPSSAPTSPTQSLRPEDIMVQARDKMMSGDMKAYNTLMDAYYAAVKK
jgi:chromosome segregation ATPase